MLLWLSAHCKTNTLTSFGNRYILNCIIPATISLNSTTIVGKTIFSSGSSFFASGFLVKSKSFQYRQICYEYLFINTISGSSSTRFSVRVLYLVFSHFYSSIRPHLVIMGEWEILKSGTKKNGQTLFVFLTRFLISQKSLLYLQKGYITYFQNWY